MSLPAGRNRCLQYPLVTRSAEGMSFDGLRIWPKNPSNGIAVLATAGADGCRLSLLRPRRHRLERLGSRYTSGRTRDWIKMKNPAAPAVKRQAEEDWGR